MPKTPDRRPGVSDEEGVNFENSPDGLASSQGQLRYSGGRFSFYDSAGEYNPRSGGGISEAQHKILRQLIHFIDEGPAEGFASGAYKEVTGQPFPTSVIWWESSSKAKKIVEKTITYGTSPKVVTSIVWKMYDTDGTSVLATVTDAITYSSGVFEASRTRTIA